MLVNSQWSTLLDDVDSSAQVSSHASLLIVIHYQISLAYRGKLRAVP